MPTVLVIDDDLRLRELMAAILRAEGFEVHVAADGKAGIQSLQERLDAGNAPYDLLVTDIVMPEMDGAEIIRRVRAMCPSVSLVAVSGGSRYMNSALCLKTAKLLGAQAVVSKPFSKQEFMGAITKALDTNSVDE